MTIYCAVIGNPITQSLSPIIHQYFASQTGLPLRYERIEGSLDRFEQEVVTFFSQNGKGLNVTAPFKQRAFALAEIKTARCLTAAAANTLWMEGGQLHADNTDGSGFMRDLARYHQPTGKNILILGAGGAARGLIIPLLEACPLRLTLANRSPERRVALQHDYPQIRCLNIEALRPEFDLIIHAGAGASFNLENETLFQNQPFCYDLAYKAMAIDLSLKQQDRFFASILKQSTPFLEYAKRFGCESIDGLGMLIEQAAESFSIWHGIRPELKGVLPEHK